MKLYYSDVLSPHKACAVARYLKSPVEFVYLDLVKGEQQAPAYLVLIENRVYHGLHRVARRRLV
jgi:glutathione S-transferase